MRFSTFMQHKGFLMRAPYHWTKGDISVTKQSVPGGGYKLKVEANGKTEVFKADSISNMNDIKLRGFVMHVSYLTLPKEQQRPKAAGQIAKPIDMNNLMELLKVCQKNGSKVEIDFTNNTMKVIAEM
jgi:hypothetical protein